VRQFSLSHLFLSCIPIKTFPATCFAHHILLEITTHITFGDQYISRSFLSCGFLHSPANSTLSDPLWRGTARTSQFTSQFFSCLIIMCAPSSVFCVLFVCKCVLYYCHRVSTQLQLNNNNNNNNNFSLTLCSFLSVKTHISYPHKTADGRRSDGILTFSLELPGGKVLQSELCKPERVTSDVLTSVSVNLRSAWRWRRVLWWRDPDVSKEPAASIFPQWRWPRW
jgi:hypothetical protein